MNKLPTIILASSSPRRKALLQGVNVPFLVHPSHADESLSAELSPGANVEVLARRKAEVVAAQVHVQFPEAVVIGADTVVVLAGKILGKPASREEAAAMLSELQGQTHQVFTGLCVKHLGTGQTLSGFSRTEVTLRQMSAAEIKGYVATGEPMDKAGAYGIQGYGCTLVPRISGDYFTVVGLPMALLEQFLNQWDLSLLDFSVQD